MESMIMVIVCSSYAPLTTVDNFFSMWISFMDTQTLWQIVLADLEVQVTKVIFQTLLLHTKLLQLTDTTATIGCAQPLLINLLEKKYYQLIKKTLDNYTKTDIKLIFTALPMAAKKQAEGPLFTFKPHSLPPPASTARLNPEYTFENFAVSSSNQMAYAAATAVAKKPGSSYNPLFIYGGVGVGKTHLIQAIGHTALQNNPSAKLIYCTSEEFTNDIIEAIGSKTTVTFKKKYRYVHILLIDDIQFIAGKNAVQEEFFHTFNALQQVGGQVVLISDRPPEEIDKLEERLRSRFEGGLTVDIGPPDFELRCAILLIKAKQKDIALPMEIAKIIAASIENPRKLEGVLTRIHTESQTRNLPIDEELVKLILGNSLKEQIRRHGVKPEDVVNTIASYYNIKLSQLKSSKRDRSLSFPRQILYYILRSELHIPLTVIGDLLSGRDHTTILYGVRKVSDLLSTNNIVREDVMRIKQRLFG